MKTALLIVAIMVVTVLVVGGVGIAWLRRHIE